jgi:hypothetical protein
LGDWFKGVLILIVWVSNPSAARALGSYFIPQNKHCLIYSVEVVAAWWEDAGYKETLNSTGGCEIYMVYIRANLMRATSTDKSMVATVRD